MKQSKKLLSIFLAMLMLIGTVSVLGNAAVAKTDVQYDSIDNAKLTSQQVAGIVLDMVDEMLSGIDVSDINDITKLLGVTLDFSSLDKAYDSIYGAKSVLQGSLIGGDIKKIDVDAFKNKTRAKTGDIGMVVALLQFLADNFGSGMNIQKAVYAIGADSKTQQFGVGDLLWEGKIIGISLGFSVQEILDDPMIEGWSVNGILNDLSGFLKYMIFDMIMYGSYPYSSDGVNKEYSEVSSEFTGVTLDGMVDIILKNFLTTPQNYKYVNDVKVWDETSYLLSADKYAKLGDVSLANNSLFDFIDKILQIAYEDFGTVVLNHDVKKLFMEAMGVDFVTLDETIDAAEIAKIKKDADYVDVDTAAANKVATVKNYFCNAQMWEVDGVWYFRDYVTRDVLDAEGNVVGSEKQHRFQRAEVYSVDSLYYLFNWDYALTATTLDFNAMLKEYGSIIGCLNHLLYVIFQQAVDAKALGLTSIDQIWVDGGNDKFNENIMSTAKFLLKNFTFKFFGRNADYVDLNTLKATSEFVAKVDACATLEDLVAYIALPFLGDALPQLVYDYDMFTSGLQIEQVAALLVREFLSDLTPQINYDAEIFEDASLVTGRKFKTHTSAEWMTIILNMGLDLGMTYLDNITNINVTADGLRNLHAIAESVGVPSWKVVLEEIVDWAVLYIGEGDMSAIVGASPNELNAVRCITDGTNATSTNYVGNAFTTVSTVLNNLLPLGFLCNVTSDSFALDTEMAINRLIDVIDDLDLEVLLGTFGRNDKAYNIFTADNVLSQILQLVNKLIGCLFGRGLFNDTSSIEAILSKDNLSALLVNLIDGLYDRSEILLTSLLGTVAQFVPDWGGEQTFRAPSTSLDESYNLSSGSRSDITFDITNGSKRIWRGYMDGTERKQDEQYSVTVKDVAAYNFDGSASPYVSITSKPSGIGYGQSGQVKFSVSGVPAEGALVRFDITYAVTNGIDGTELPGTYTKSEIVAFNYSDSTSYVNQTSNQQDNKAYTPLFANLENISEVTDIHTVQLYRKDASSGKTTQPAAVTVTSEATQSGITYSSVSADIKKDTTLNYNTLTVDEAAFAAANLKSGDSLSWTVQITAYEEKSSKEVKLYLYNGSELEQLKELVNSEIDQMRLPTDYDTSNAAWSTYYSAFLTAFAAAKQRLDANAVGRLNYSEYYKNLEAAIEGVEKIKKETTVASTAIATLRTTVDAVEKELNGKDYRTFALYRWDRFQDQYKSAKKLFALDEEVKLGVETKNNYYSDLTANEVTALVANDTYKDYVLATLVDKTEEELREAKKDYNDAKADLASYQMIDIANTNSMLPVLVDRLVARDDGVKNDYLKKEIASAKATFTDSSKYSAKSWEVYSKALANAEAVVNSDSQDTIFDAKYQLQVARNNLVLATDEADYSELTELISQAENALKNASSYKNVPADFGAVLAALGYEVKDGDEIVQLYPDSAKVVVTKAYSTADQDEIDDAADELKKALAKLEFSDYTKPSGVEAKDVTTGKQGEDGNAITESVNTKVIDVKQKFAAVETALASAGCTVEVSLDDKYTAKGSEDTTSFVGTGATVTLLKEVGGAKVPVATIKIIVEGDVTGDGVIDALDCMVVQLVSTNNTTLSGVYEIAADLVPDSDGIDAKDFGEVVNKAIAG